MKITIDYGKEHLHMQIDEKDLLGILYPRKISSPGDSSQIIKQALANPIGSGPLKETVKPGEKIAIVTSDITRPCPSRDILPPLLEELTCAGIRDEDVTIYFALGSHRGHTRKEMENLVGTGIFSRYRCEDHDVGQCIRLGATSRGTPVDINRQVITADRRILVGNIEYHYFAGYSGGVKAMFPGISSTDAIQANHSMMLLEGATTGNLLNNPVREDLEEIAGFTHIDLILNVVLGPHKEILRAFAGHYIHAHREGCRFLDSLYRIPLEDTADIVLVSAGGFPKDINIYQAQKALDNAVHAVRKGGVIIWAASCIEGYGSDVFRRWIEESREPGDIIERIRANFELGGHKAAAIMKAREKANILFLSELPPEYAESMYLTYCPSLSWAISKASELTGGRNRTLVMPYGGSTLPYIGK
ncbi:MAG: nickel-dependent lactate racemase [Synergistales bacterium]|nr:nickel-dependent lactate racemase [Synergistales bacterium]